MPTLSDIGIVRSVLVNADAALGAISETAERARASRRMAPAYNRAMDSRPVGVFDSGTGGLTVLHECLVTMPHEDFVYLGDHARLPYGPRSLDEVRGFALEIGL